MSGKTWAYLRKVVAGSACPSISATVLASNPPRIIRGPAVSLRSWKSIGGKAQVLAVALDPLRHVHAGGVGLPVLKVLGGPGFICAFRRG